MAIFDFESICAEDEIFKFNQTTWIERHIPFSVLILSNLIQEPLFLFNANPSDLISFFIDALENFVTQCEAQMEKIFPQIEAAI